MNRSFFSKTKYMIGVGLKKTGSHTHTKIIPKFPPSPPPPPRAATGWLYRYYTAIWSLFRHMECDVPVSCEANGDRNQLWAWCDSDPKADS